MNLSEVNDLFTGTFPSVIMSDMTEYWKDFLFIFHTLLLSIYANHFTNFFSRSNGQSAGFAIVVNNLW